MNQNRPILFEEGLMKVRWEDMYIDIPFDFGNTHEIIFYKVTYIEFRYANSLKSSLRNRKKKFK